MNFDDFTSHIEETFNTCRDLLSVKNGEYSGDQDALGNFKRGALLAGVTPLQAALIYASKHFDAVATYVKDDARGETRQRSELISGRLHDLINYMILMEALVKDGEQR